VASSGGADFSGFCAAAAAVEQGECTAAEVAGLSLQDYIACGQVEQEQCISDSVGEMDNIRQKMQQLLLVALEDGSLRNAFEQGASKDSSKQAAVCIGAPGRNPDLVSATREQIKRSLISSLEDGRLEAALSDNARAKAPDKVADDGSGSQVIFSDKTDRLQRRSQETMDVLLGALEEESCEASLQLPQPRPLVAEAPQEEDGENLPVDVQNLRASAKKLLMQASQDGSLMTMLSEVKQETQLKSQLTATLGE